MLDVTHKLFMTSLVAFFPFYAQLPIAMTFTVCYTIVLLSSTPYVDILNGTCVSELKLGLCFVT
jgi:hypothetical protein